MKNEYGKKDYQNKDYQKGYKGGYEATTGKENRNPNAPTQGGFSKTGGDLGNKNKQYQPNKPTTPGQNSWGTGSINTDKNKDRR